MSATDFIEIGRVVGLITGVWFTLVGWKLLPLIRPTGAGRPDAPSGSAK